MKAYLAILSLLIICAQATSLSALVLHIRKLIYEVTSGRDLFTLMIASKAYKEEIKAFMIDSAIMRHDPETGLFHPDYSHHSWHEESAWNDKALSHFDVSPNSLPPHSIPPTKGSYGPTFTYYFGRNPTPGKACSVIPLLRRGGYTDTIMRLVCERGLKLSCYEVSEILFSSEFSDAQLLEVIDRIDDTKIIRDAYEAAFITQARLISSMIRKNFKLQDLLDAILVEGPVFLCTIYCLIKYGYFEADLVASRVNHPSFFRSSDDGIFSFDRFFDGIAGMVDSEQKMAILSWLRTTSVLELSHVASLYLADESGHKIFDASLQTVNEHGYHIFNALFCSSALGRCFAKDLKSGPIQLTIGSRQLYQTLCNCEPD